MVLDKYKEDYEFAQRLCLELLRGNKAIINELYQKFHLYFSEIIKPKIYSNDPDENIKILDDFWVELLNGNAICAYKGKASLKNYLLGILSRRTIDANRRYYRDKKNKILGESSPLKAESVDCPEKELISHERKKIIQEAILDLESVFFQDADLVRMRFEGLTFKEMAEKYLAGSSYTSEDFKKKEGNIRKRFTRSPDGSLARFRIALERRLNRKNLSIDEFFK